MVATKLTHEKEPLPLGDAPVLPGPYVQVTGLPVPMEKPKWSWCNLGTSLFATLCCCSPFGLIGLVYSLLAYVDHKGQDFARSQRKKKHSWGWTITAIVLGTLVILAMVGLVVHHYRSYRMYTMYGDDIVYDNNNYRQWGHDRHGYGDDVIDEALPTMEPPMNEPVHAMPEFMEKMEKNA